MNKRLLPAYPLFVNDPFFSIWSGGDVLNQTDAMFWNGRLRKTYGVVNADGQTFSFLGMVDGATPLEQTSVSVTAFTTEYGFTCDKFDLTVRFVSPLLPTDVELAARPVCYMGYEITPRQAIGKLTVSLALHECHCYDRVEDFVIGGAFEMQGYQTAFFGLNRQHPMSHTGDSFAADWGYWYVSAKQAYFLAESDWNKFVGCGTIDYNYIENDKKYIAGFDSNDNVAAGKTLAGKMTVAFDDLCSIFYFGEWLKGYYFRDGKTIFDAIDQSYNDYETTLAKLSVFEIDLDKRLQNYDEDYRLLCVAALRQTMGAHKIVQNAKGQLLFLSKECHSNGCIATADITYPSMPLFLLYNPSLVQGMLAPIFDFARMPVWKYDFAPHDAGTYPYCLGQMYAVKANADKNDRFVSNMFRRNRQSGIIVSHPMVYQYPQNAEIYNFDCQMPIEECSNMIIAAYASVRCGGDDKILRDNYDTLKTWYDYLDHAGLVPERQLCTDDFVERLDKNVNLSAKAIVAIKCFALVAKRFGHGDDEQRAEKRLAEYLDEFYRHFDGVDHLPLTYDSDESTYGLKYNMAYDVLFGFGLFSEGMREREMDYYTSHAGKLSVALDNRYDLTKTDWILYTCALTDDRAKQRALYKGVAEFLRTSPCRVPFSDLYHVDGGLIKDFQNRTVQGGIFILLLKDELQKNK